MFNLYRISFSVEGNYKGKDIIYSAKKQYAKSAYKECLDVLFKEARDIQLVFPSKGKTVEVNANIKRFYDFRSVYPEPSMYINSSAAVFVYYILRDGDDAKDLLKPEARSRMHSRAINEQWPKGAAAKNGVIDEWLSIHRQV